MNKCKSMILFTILIYLKVGAEQVYIAPLLSVDEGEESYQLDDKFRDDVYESIEDQKDFLGVEIIKTSKRIKHVRSSYDALRLCKTEKIRYLIYGWIKKREYSYEGELRVFDGEGRKNIFSVYEKDGVKEYEQFIKNISRKVLEKLQEIFYIPKKEEIERYSIINVQTEIGYWTYMNEQWVKYMSGILKAGCGFEIIPDDSVFFIKKYPVYFSAGLDLEYRFGVSRKGAVESYVNNINAVGFSNMYINFYDLHRVYGRGGILYSLDILSYRDKYSDARVNSSSAIGMVVGFGYKYKVSAKVKVILANDFEFVFYKKIMPRYIGKMGVEIEVYKKEYKRP